MESASTCNTSWKNLSSFGHALSELSEILVINSLDSVSTEHANLLARLLRGTGISFLFHDFSSYQYKVTLSLERNVAVAEDFFKIAQIAIGHTVIILCGLLWSCLLRSLIVILGCRVTRTACTRFLL